MIPATKFGDIPILAHRLYVSNIVAGQKNGAWNPIILQEFKSRLLNEVCIVRVEDVPQIENMKLLPCSIEPRRMPCDIYKWLLKEKLGYFTDIDDNGDGILIV